MIDCKPINVGQAEYELKISRKGNYVYFDIKRTVYFNPPEFSIERVKFRCQVVAKGRNILPA